MQRTSRVRKPSISTCRTCKVETIWLSWSRLRTHEECRQKGYLSRNDNREVTNVRNFLGGNLVDRVVRDWLLDDPINNLDAMPEMIPEYIKSVEKEATKKDGAFIKWHSTEDRDNVIKDGIEAVRRIQPDLEELVLPYEFQADYAFKTPVKVDVRGHGEVELMLNGFMDILVKRAPQEFSILDVKMTKNESYWKKTVGQLIFYDTSLILSEGVYGMHHALLQPMCKEQVKTFDVRNEDRMKMFQSISSYAADVLNENFAPTKETSICGNCDFKNACVLFKPQIVNGKRKITL